MRQLQTRYRIRANIPSNVVSATDLIAKARSAGVELKQDSKGTVEGVWDSTYLSLERIVERLLRVGLRGFMVEKSVISVTVAVSAQRLEEAEAALRKVAIGLIQQTEDVFTGDEVLTCIIPCELGLSLSEGLEKISEYKMIATESFVVVTEKTDE